MEFPQHALTMDQFTELLIEAKHKRIFLYTLYYDIRNGHRHTALGKVELLPQTRMQSDGDVKPVIWYKLGTNEGDGALDFLCAGHRCRTAMREEGPGFLFTNYWFAYALSVKIKDGKYSS